jgi:hypothetical protein
MVTKVLAPMVSIAMTLSAVAQTDASIDTSGGWMKYCKNPVLGGE